VSGDVEIGPDSSILFGAVLTADGGPIRIGANCVIMENAVVRGTPKNPTVIGDRVLVGPHAHLTGCIIEAGTFLATGSTIFNGVTIGEGSEVRINAIVHVNSRLEPGTMVPIGWIAVGDPAQLFSPDQHDQLWPVQRSMNFSETVWKGKRTDPTGDNIARYARALTRHKEDKILEP